MVFSWAFMPFEEISKFKENNNEAFVGVDF